MPKVSVIIPVYGAEKYMERCVRSLFEQTLDDIEYLFIDDCTPDNSMAVLNQVMEEYPARKKQVTIHRMEKNSGQAAVRAWGMQNAKGDFVIHCDSDDWVELDAYRKMYEKAISENSDVVVCDFAMTDGTTVYRILKGCGTTNKDQFIQRLLLQNDSWSLCNKLFRRSACFKGGLIYPEGNMGEDMALCFQLLLNGEMVSYISETLYNYFYNCNSTTHSANEQKKMANFYENKDNADILFKTLQKHGLLNKYSDGVIYVKWRIKMLLWFTEFDSAKYSLWKETYPEIDLKMLTLPKVKLSDRIKYYLTNLRLYPRN